GNPDVGGSSQRVAEELPRRDADYGERSVVERDGAAQDRRVPGELPLPEAVADHRRLGVSGREHPAEESADSKDREVALRDEPPPDVRRRRKVADAVDLDPKEGDAPGGEHAFEHVLARRHVPEDRVTQLTALAAVERFDDDELVGVPDREALEENGVD